MRLKVIPIIQGEADWYDKPDSEGLRFSCTQCGDCCTGGPGVVWISKEEIVRLAEFLKISPEETVERYCRKIDQRFSLNERRNRYGKYDCVFLTEQTAGNQRNAAGVKAVRRGCSIYPVRPLQCRTWPFWPENLVTEEAWDAASKKCPGMNVGRNFSVEQVIALRDAEDWPARPPGSATNARDAAVKPSREPNRPRRSRKT